MTPDPTPAEPVEDRRRLIGALEVGLFAAVALSVVSLIALASLPWSSTRGSIARIHLPSAPFGRPVVFGGSVWQIAGTDLVRVPMSTLVPSRVPLDGTPSWVDADAGALWVVVCAHQGAVGCTRGTVERLDPGDGRVLASFPAGEDPTRVLVDGDTLWIVDLRPQGIVGVDAATGDVRARILDSRDCCQGLIPSDLAVSSGLLWAVASGVLIRIDPNTPHRYPTVVSACDVAGDDTAVWSASCDDTARRPQTVWRVDPVTATATGVQTTEGNPHLGLGGGFAWVASYRSDDQTVEIRQLDAQTGREVSGTIVVPDDPAAFMPSVGPGTMPGGPFLSFGAGFVWLASEQDGELIRVGVG